MTTTYRKFPLIIAGGRNFNDIRLMFKSIKDYCRQRNLSPSDIQFVSGGAEGADKLGEFIANHFGSDLKRYEARWDEFGQMAGFMRNEQMAQYTSEMKGGCIVFWDGVSKGSKHMIKIAKEYNIDCKVVNYWNGNLKLLN